MLTDAELQQIRERCDKATPGPWFPVFTDDANSMNAVYVGTVDRGQMHDNARGFSFDSPRQQEIIAVTLYQLMPRIDHDSELWDENADFIANARADMPRLLDEITRLAGRVAELEAESSEAHRLLGEMTTLAESLRAELAETPPTLEWLRQQFREPSVNGQKVDVFHWTRGSGIARFEITHTCGITWDSSQATWVQLETSAAVLAAVQKQETGE